MGCVYSICASPTKDDVEGKSRLNEGSQQSTDDFQATVDASPVEPKEDVNDSNSTDYSSLIYASEQQFAPYHPTVDFDLGDYGVFEESLGTFSRRGNIFLEHSDLWSQVGPQTEAKDEERFIFKSATGIGDPELHFFDIQVQDSVSSPYTNSSFSKAWRFRKGRHAALFVVDPVHHRVTHGNSIGDYLAKYNAKYYSEFAIVTEVVRCTSYCTIVANGEKGGRVMVGFDASAASPSPWTTDVINACCQTGAYDVGIHRYAPLCTLKTLGVVKQSTKLDVVLEDLTSQDAVDSINGESGTLVGDNISGSTASSRPRSRINTWDVTASDVRMRALRHEDKIAEVVAGGLGAQTSRDDGSNGSESA